MCGIAGKISWTKTPDPSVVRAMTNEMFLRGPDADGFFENDIIAFGHRRLAIIDLSENGKQPMFDHSRSLCITFNGEIYNFQALRTELETLGARFKTASDTEVILEAYKCWGVSCVEHFNGMFAFALWDFKNQRLFLARDRLGKKPLFYYPLQGGGVAFASELKALLKDPEIPRQISPRALDQYLSLSYVLSDSCIIDGVKKLPAGHILVLERNSEFSPKSYWNLADCFNNKVTLGKDDAAEQLLALLDDSTKLRMISDVPLGAFLSGGIDSSSIAASMCHSSDPKRVSTFSIGFNEKSYNELPQARSMAAHLGVNHRDKIVDAEMANILRTIVTCGDEPFADNSTIPTYYLSQFTRQFVTVALSGDGGDEIFAGYETYLADKLHPYLKILPASIFGILAAGIKRILPVSFDKVSFDFKLRKFLEAHQKSFREAHYSWRTIFTPQDKTQLVSQSVRNTLSEAMPFSVFNAHFDAVSACHPLDQAMYVDIKTWLVDDILVKADRMSMANSLELRAPLLDYRLVEFAASLPHHLKLNGFNKKYILKKSQLNRLPRQTISQKKRGFNSPVALWLTTGLGQRIREMLERKSLLAEIIELSYAKALFEEHLQGRADNSFKLFNLLVLSEWLEVHRPTGIAA